MQIGLNMSLSGLRTLDPAASVRALFANDEPGVWFEANDANTLFTDVAGTTPVTTPGDAVALQLDKSQGLQLGPELVTNGTFDTDSDWTKGTGWTISGGVASSSDGSSSALTQSVSTTTGKIYAVTFTISNGSGSWFLGVRLGSTTNQYTFTTTGTKTVYLIDAGDHRLRFADGAVGSFDIDNISVRELPGNHRTQATTAARPLYALHPVGGVRNLLEYTEEFDNAVWIKSESGVATAPVVTEDFADGPLPNTRASRIVFNLNGGTTSSDVSQIRNSTPYVLDEYTVSFWLRSNTGSNYDIIFTIGNSQVGEVTVTSTWQRLSLTFTPSVDNAVSAGIRTRGSLGSSDVTDILVWGAQFEQGSTATNYQRVGSFLDVSEEGKARRGRLWYNGTSHFMQTGTITPGTDKVQVFAGIRKLRNNAQEAVLELNNFAEAGLSVQTLTTFAPWRFGSRGDAAPSIADATSNTFPSPVSSIITGLGDISGDSAILRVDGVQEAISTADQGAGNYATSQLRFGARAGTSLFYNGYEDTSIIRFGPNLDTDTISKVESYVASKTPASELLIPAGPELVTNGTFDTDVSGWTATRSASLALVSNTIEVTGTGTTQSAASQGITTTIGETYVVSFDLVSETGTARFAVSSQDNLNTAPDILNNLSLSAGQSYTFTFKANATTTYLHLASAGATDVTSWDNVSVRQLIPK